MTSQESQHPCLSSLSLTSHFSIPQSVYAVISALPDASSFARLLKTARSDPTVASLFLPSTVVSQPLFGQAAQWQPQSTLVGKGL